MGPNIDHSEEEEMELNSESLVCRYLIRMEREEVDVRSQMKRIRLSRNRKSSTHE